MENRETLLKIENLNVYFKTENGRIQAVKDVSFEIGNFRFYPDMEGIHWAKFRFSPI